MLKFVMLFAVAGALLAACSSDSNSATVITPTAGASTAVVAPTTSGPGAPTGAATATPGAGAPYSAAAVWDAVAFTNPNNTDLLRQLQQCKGPPTGTDCAVQVMQAAGASAQAVAFFKETGWFLTRFLETGAVDVGTIVSPWRANANEQYYLMNGQPPLVSPEEQGAKVSLTTDPNYQALVDAVAAVASPGQPAANLIIFPGDDAYESSGPNPQGGQRFVIQYNIVNVCHACGTGYRERVGLDFDSSGKYLGASLVGMCRGDGAQLNIPGTPSCPATSP